MVKSAEDGVFEIGLVMAGAVSAGAYTAGVLDYLQEKLIAFENWQGPNKPKHKVKIRVLSGASAGGISSAFMLAQSFGRIKTGVTNGDFDPDRSLLYNIWVDGVDIQPMLKNDDVVPKDAVVVSLLNTEIIEDLARQGIDLDPIDISDRPNYFSETIDVVMSVSNMRGVPYRLETQGNDAGHNMVLHSDHMRFQIVANGTVSLDAVQLIPEHIGVEDANWIKLSQAAKATSAFPLALLPQVIERPASDYSKREWSIPMEGEDGQCSSIANIDPDWGLNEEPYEALCVDGGLMNNEPLELARTTLAGVNGRNPRDPKTAFRATLIIDPFPGESNFDPKYKAEFGIHKVFLSMFSALKDQARFKPDELVLAQRKDCFSRFMIAPKRTEVDDSETKPALQSAILGGFGGFLARAFREHDYKLGRRNCESFLKNHFYLHADSPLFKGGGDERWTPGAPYLKDRPCGEGVTMPSLPILPVENPELKEEELLPTRVVGSSVVDVDALYRDMEPRLKPLIKRFIRRNLGMEASVLGIKFGLGTPVWKFAKKKLETFVKETLKQELSRLD